DDMHAMRIAECRRAYLQIQKSGNYSDPTVWTLGIAPPIALADTDILSIYAPHIITVNNNLFINCDAGIFIGGELRMTAGNYVHFRDAYLLMDTGRITGDSVSFTGTTTIQQNLKPSWIQNISIQDSLHSHGGGEL